MSIIVNLTFAEYSYLARTLDEFHTVWMSNENDVFFFIKKKKEKKKIEINFSRFESKRNFLKRRNNEVMINDEYLAIHRFPDVKC